MKEIIAKITEMLKNGYCLVAIMRHGEKLDDNLTAKGAAQVFAAAKQLASLGLIFVRFRYSGLERARQTAMIAAAALCSGREDVGVEVIEGLNFKKAIDANYPDGSKAFMAHWEELKKARDGKPTVADAQAVMPYTETARTHLATAIVAMATTEAASFGASHSPYTELATCHPEATPFGLGEADIVVYAVNVKEGGVIVDSVYIPAPQIA